MSDDTLHGARDGAAEGRDREHTARDGAAEGRDREHGLEPDVRVPRFPGDGPSNPPHRDPVVSTSDASFPASDPPSWSGSASIRAREEAPPEGEQASWSVDREAPGSLDGNATTGLDPDGEPDAALPVAPEDARQA